MEFTVKKISDHGTSNQIVARLSVQTSELINFYPLNEKQRKKILEIYILKMQPKLLRCYEIKELLLSELIKISDEFNEKGIHAQSSGRITTVPQMMNLQESCESYLYSAKSFLRDLAGVFEPLFEQSFKEARYDKIYKWSKTKFGKEDSLTVGIKQDHDLWIRRIVSMRNALEHPGGHSGFLYINNIDIASDLKTNSPLLVPPTWNLNYEPRTPVLHDVDIFIHNLLEFAEDLLVLCLEKLEKKFPIIVAEIPEAARNPECPTRFRMILKKN